MRTLQSGRYHATAGPLLLAAAVILLALGTGSLAAEPDFKIGDRYTLLVRRGDVTLSPSGTLIQATPRWLVLNCVDVSSSITGIPYLIDLPLVGFLFQVEQQQLMGQHAWIPPRQPRSSLISGRSNRPLASRSRTSIPV